MLAVLLLMVLSYRLQRIEFFVVSSALAVLAVPSMLILLGHISASSIHMPKKIFVSVTFYPHTLIPALPALLPLAASLAP